MSQPTTLPAQIVADTIVRTVELGVRITNAALAGETTVVFAELVVDGPGSCPDCGLVGLYRDTAERRGAARPKSLLARSVRPADAPAHPAAGSPGSWVSGGCSTYPLPRWPITKWETRSRGDAL
jgi:hypothetical protein